MTETVEMTAADQRLLTQIMHSKDSTIATLVPEDVKQEDFDRYLSTFCRGFGKARSAMAVLKPLIGRLLVIAKNNPSYYKSQYETFDAFLDGIEERFGICRSECFEIIKIAQAWPALDVDTYRKIGTVNLRIASKFSSQADAGYQKVLDKAAASTVREFRQWAEETGRVNKGETIGATIVLSTTAEIANRWREFVNDAKNQGHCGTDNPGAILGCMMEECSSWQSEGE